MKRIITPTFILTVFLLTGCGKPSESGTYSESAEGNVAVETEAASAEAPPSMAVTQEVEGKKFVRTVDVKMDVKDVYQATVAIEDTLKSLNGFVISGNYQTFVEKENTHSVSNEKAVLIREYWEENKMQVKVPTEKLAAFLAFLNKQSAFLCFRGITATDVSIDIQQSQLEQQRLKQNKENLEKLKNSHKTADAINTNSEDEINRQVADLHLLDNLKYSTVDIFLHGIKARIARIEVANTQSLDSGYKGSFWYDLQQAFYSGFYSFQNFVVFVANLWLYILMGIAIFWAWRRFRNKKISK